MTLWHYHMLFGELLCCILHRWTEMSLWGRCRGTCTRSRKWKSSQPWENSERRWGPLTVLFSPHQLMDDSEACAPESHVLLKLHRHISVAQLSLGWLTSCCNRLQRDLKHCDLAWTLWSRLNLTMHLFLHLFFFGLFSDSSQQRMRPSSLKTPQLLWASLKKWPQTSVSLETWFYNNLDPVCSYWTIWFVSSSLSGSEDKIMALASSGVKTKA